MTTVITRNETALTISLRLKHRFTQADVELVNYSSWFLGTPVMEHATYAAIALVIAGLLLWRRQPVDIPIAGLQLAAAAFAASFFIISIACDYRYLYFTDLAALAGLIYAAVDPPWADRSSAAKPTDGSANARY